MHDLGAERRPEETRAWSAAVSSPAPAASRPRWPMSAAAEHAHKSHHHHHAGNGHAHHHDGPHQDYDPTQLAFLDEVCLLVDENDRPIGSQPKGQCHLMTEINKGTLHRAFSIFLFNKRGQLCLQQRSRSKITFPEYWTNTCCSHPIITPDKSELVEEDQIAKRKLEHEMNIVLPVEAFQFVTRIHYKAPSSDKWGEHEIDYVLFAVVDDSVSIHAFNPNEVMDAKYVTRDQLKAMIEQAKTASLKLTPWFHLITQANMFFDWWDNYTDVAAKRDASTIHRLGL